jgi:hypothetical protein
MRGGLMGCDPSRWRRGECFAVLVILLLGITVFSVDAAQAEDGSGMSLALYGDPDYPDARYPLSTDAEDYIKLIIVLKNISGWPLSIDSGLSQIELPTTLILTDPCGITHELSPEAGEFAFDAPPPLSVGGRPVSRAEVLPPDFVVSSTVADLRKLFPVLSKVAGLYTLRAELQFTLFKWTFRDVRLGLMGVEDYPGNWSGTLRSDKMQIYVSPDGSNCWMPVLSLPSPCSMSGPRSSRRAIFQRNPAFPMPGRTSNPS